MDSTARFLIAAPASGCGKTTVTLGLLRCLRNRGLEVQPFKCGPDYIDTKFHDLASGGRSYNLDTFLSSEKHVEDLFTRYGTQKDVCVAEGVMGLFDGYDRMQGSSAGIASLLDLPVILVVNARSMAYSAAALLYGFKNFCKEIRLAGVIFNFAGSASHYNYLKEACREVGIEPLGWLPKESGLEVPSRHLGLSIDREFVFDAFAEKAAQLIEKQIDVDRLLALTAAAPLVGKSVPRPVKGDLKIAVARDEAFNFVYHENIHLLEQLGAISWFSPLRDAQLPEAGFVYLPGGYPELYLPALSANTAMQQSIRAYVERGGKLWAECGGMMYLSESITDKEGNLFPMTGIFKQKATMQQMKLRLGYRQFSYNNLHFKGHEFHYSTTGGELASQTIQYNAKGNEVDTKLLRYKNALAGYTHLYWGDKGNILDIFL